MPIQIELRRIISRIMNTEEDADTVGDPHIIVLKELEGDRSFPIVIGMFEATSISRRVHGEVTQRPLTHDLILSVIENMGGELQDVIISDLQNHTYFAKLRVRQDGELLEIDCRPSDAIPIAVTAKVPIYVNEDVLGEAMEE
jgi:uncharacterized protein